MEKIEDDLEGYVTTRDPAILEEMIHRQGLQWLNHRTC